MKNYIIKDYAKRICILMAGLVLCATAMVMNLESLLGSNPWNAFHQGVALQTGIQIGTITQLAGLVFLVVDYLMREPIGFGTIANMYLVGYFMNAINNNDIIPDTDNIYMRVTYLFVSIVLQAVGTCLYMSANLGSGPRDSLMVGLSKRMKKIPIGWIRNGIEFIAASIGYLLGGVINIGTIVYVVLVGPCLQLCFKLSNYNPRTQRTESMAMTIAVFKGDLMPLEEYKKQLEQEHAER